MGSDKARVPFPHRAPMAASVAEVLSAVCERVRIVRGVDDGLPFVDRHGRAYEVVFDGGGERHPLRGVAAALSIADGPLALICACDLAWITADDLRGFTSPAVADDGERIHPLLAAIPTDRAALAAHLVAEGAAARDLVADLPRRAMPADRLRGFEQWDPALPLPSRALADGLPWLVGSDAARVVAGERLRLRARGAIEPGDTVR